MSDFLYMAVVAEKGKEGGESELDYTCAHAITALLFAFSGYKMDQ